MSFSWFFNLGMILLLSRTLALADPQGEPSQGEKSRETVRITIEEKVLVWSRPSGSSELLASLQPGTVIEILDYHAEEKFYAIRFKDRMGYLKEAEVKKNPALDALVRRAIQEREEQERKIAEQREAFEDKRRLENEASKREFLTLKFGEKIANAIMEHKVWEGMNKQMVLLSLGKPKSITRMVFSSVIKEQWEYDKGRYLFFENDYLRHIGGPPWKKVPPNQ